MSNIIDINEESDNNEINETNFRRIHEKAGKIGYGDGVGAGKERLFQTGFDRGYIDGLRTGFELEKFRSFFSTVSERKDVDDRFLNEAQVYDSMGIAKTTNQSNFQYTNHRDSSIEKISSFQKEYLENRLRDLKEKLPATNDLFS